MTTTLLLERLKDSRDQDAWQTFDKRFRGVIIAVARKLGLGEADSADAAQETIFQAIRDYQAGKYDRSRGRLSTWIITIARHRIIDLIAAVKRRGSRSSSLSVPDLPEPSEDDVASAFDESLEKRIFEEAWEQVRTTSQIAPATLLAFELTALRHVPATEAAQQCGMSVDQVYVAKTRVSKRLREVVEQLATAYRDGL